jgi:hypothetical protein
MKESYTEGHKDTATEKLTQMFGEDIIIENDPKDEELFDLIFSTILSKSVYISGQSRMEEHIYYLAENEEIKELNVQKDHTSQENYTEPAGGELVIDALVRLPISEKILYLIKKSEIPSGIEGEIPDFVPSDLKEKLEKLPSLLEDEMAEAYKFDKRKIYEYIKVHEGDENVLDSLSRSENSGKCKYWLSED